MTEIERISNDEEVSDNSEEEILLGQDNYLSENSSLTFVSTNDMMISPEKDGIEPKIQQNSSPKKDGEIEGIQNFSGNDGLEEVRLQKADADSAGMDPHRLIYRVEDIPNWSRSILFGFQQLMVCCSGIVAMPLIVSDIICAHDIPIARVQLVGTMLFISGFSTILQSTFGTRLPLLQGPSFAFLPSILALMKIPSFACPKVGYYADPSNVTSSGNFSEGPYLDHVWKERMQIIQGALVSAACVQMFIGLTGIIGLVTRFVGPLTIAPLMLLLEISVVQTCLGYASQHWMSLVVIALLLSTALYLHQVNIPVPVYSKKRKLHFSRQPIFAMFPYLIAIVVAWSLCAILTETGVFADPKTPARTDLRSFVLHEAPWFRWPYPGQWGPIGFNPGVFLGMVAGTVASVIESVGDYHACARVSQEPEPPAHAVNRGIFMEGFCCFIGGFVGGVVSVTTYSENIGVIGITGVASRITMQLAGLFLILLGVFTKFGAILATLPDPIVGGILAISLAMVGGVGLSSVQLLDLRLSRNSAILGISIITGLMLPRYAEENPIRTGSESVDQMLSILLSIQMFVGGVAGFVLDNTVPGATRQQRGLKPLFEDVPDESASQPDSIPVQDVYSFHSFVMKSLEKIPGSKYMPFLPTFTALDAFKRKLSRYSTSASTMNSRKRQSNVLTSTV